MHIVIPFDRWNGKCQGIRSFYRTFRTLCVTVFVGAAWHRAVVLHILFAPYALYVRAVVLLLLLLFCCSMLLLLLLAVIIITISVTTAACPPSSVHSARHSIPSIHLFHVYIYAYIATELNHPHTIPMWPLWSHEQRHRHRPKSVS